MMKYPGISEFGDQKPVIRLAKKEKFYDRIKIF